MSLPFKVSNILHKDFISNFLITLILLALPTQLGLHFWPEFTYFQGLRIDYLSPTIYLIDCLLLFHFFLLLLTREFSISRKIFLPLLVMITFMTIASQFSQTLGLYKSITVLKCLYLAYLTRYHVTQKQLYTTLTTTMIILSLLAIIQTSLGSNVGHGLYWLGERQFDISSPGIAKTSHFGIHYLRPYATFSHPNSLAGFLLISLLILSAYWNQRGVLLSESEAMRSRSRKITFLTIQNYFFATLLILPLLTILLTDSLAAIATTFTVLLLLLLHYYYPSFTKKITLLIFTIFLTLVPLFLLITSNNHFSQSESFILRQEGYRTALALIKTYPITGTGIGQSLPISLSEKLTPTSPRHAQPIHNIILLLIIELGIPLSLFLIYKSLQLFKKTVALNFSLALTLLAILLTGSVDHYWITLSQNQVLLSLVIGLLLSNPQESKLSTQ